MPKIPSHQSDSSNREKIDYRELSMMQQAIFDGANYSIISTDVDGTIRSFNNAASRLLGYSAEELIGRFTPAIFHDTNEIAERAISLSEELGEKINPGLEVLVTKAGRGIAEEIEWSYIHKDGKRIPVLLSITALRDEEGTVNGFLGIGFDITEKVLTKQALREEEERYSLLFDSAGDSILLMKGDHFIDCNIATLNMFRCKREHIINQAPYQFSPKHQPDGTLSVVKAIEKISEAFQGKTTFFEWQHLRYDGTSFEAEVTLNAIRIKDEPHILASVRDISERKSTERELEESRKELLTRNESLLLINKLSNKLNGNHSSQSIIDETLNALLKIVHKTHVAIFLVNEEETSLQLMAGSGFDDFTMQAGQTLSLENNLSAYALNKGEIVFCEDFSTDPYIDKNIMQLLVKRNIHSGIIIPLLYQGKKLGSINILYQNKHVFSDSEKETLDVISNTVSQAIASAQQIKELEFMAHHDSLTGLSNRSLFHKTFEQKSTKPAYTSAALLLLDLDRFKEINDTLGHHTGDELLQKIGPRLKQVIGEQSILISRLGGDEFTILIDNVSDNQEILNFAEIVLNCLREPFAVGSMKLEIDASIGIAKYPEDGEDSHALLRSADVAMYEAKSKGGGIQAYEKIADKHTPERLALIGELNGAIRDNQLILHYQPKVNLVNGKISGFEALVRWQHSKMGLLFPDTFIPLAEMSDSIHYLTLEVLRKALKQQSEWYEAGYHFPVAVNLSARNLIDDTCIVIIRELLAEFNTRPGMLEIEITETAIMHDPKTAINLLNQISDLGIKLSIDDFGTGYSSLSYLHRMPINILKIDREFVKDMYSNDQDSIIVGSTIALAHNLKLEVIAEGVENKETMEQLKNMGCDLAQGYFISKPKPWPEIEKMLIQTSSF